MDICLVQCVLIGLWSGFCMTGMLMGTYVTRCLVMSAGVGVILGDIPTGLAMGAAGEMAFLGFGVSQGGSVPPNPVGPGIIGAIMAITMKGQGLEVGEALALSFPFALAAQFLITGIYALVTAFLGIAQVAVQRKKYMVFRLAANSTIGIFLLAGFAIGFAGAYSADGLRQVVSLIPGWLSTGLGVAGRMMPAIGFAMILSIMVKKELVPFLLIGFITAAYWKMPVMGSALVGTAVALLEFYREKRMAPSALKACPGSGNPGSENQDVQNSNWKLSKWDYKRTALRAYFLQNGYNYGNYEGLGYVSAMWPAWKKLYPDPDRRRDEMVKNMGFCSTNPNFLPVITSVHLVMQQHGASEEEIQKIRIGLMGPLAGIGDSLVQFCLAPLFATIGVSMARRGMLAGPACFLACMNLALLSLKMFSCSLGYRLGAGLVGQVDARLKQVSDLAGMIGVTVISALVVNFVDITTPIQFSPGPGQHIQLQAMLDMVLPGLLPVAFTGWMFFLAKRKGWKVCPMVLLAMATGLLLSRLGLLA